MPPATQQPIPENSCNSCEQSTCSSTNVPNRSQWYTGLIIAAVDFLQLHIFTGILDVALDEIMFELKFACCMEGNLTCHSINMNVRRRKYDFGTDWADDITRQSISRAAFQVETQLHFMKQDKN